MPSSPENALKGDFSLHDTSCPLMEDGSDVIVGTEDHEDYFDLIGTERRQGRSFRNTINKLSRTGRGGNKDIENCTKTVSCVRTPEQSTTSARKVLEEKHCSLRLANKMPSISRTRYYEGKGSTVSSYGTNDDESSEENSSIGSGVYGSDAELSEFDDSDSYYSASPRMLSSSSPRRQLTGVDREEKQQSGFSLIPDKLKVLCQEDSDMYKSGPQNYNSKRRQKASVLDFRATDSKSREKPKEFSFRLEHKDRPIELSHMEASIEENIGRLPRTPAPNGRGIENTIHDALVDATPCLGDPSRLNPCWKNNFELRMNDSSMLGRRKHRNTVNAINQLRS
ncbi:LAQU0S06e03290g1_1 [Lachancea quebecensis]|uniref:LAQU0S06e03290g1_1 n=1 Tax=Lachancea quebecensis TaxID=1654605 RepID=A0A0P1KRS5_9SACH|nr:LAQU0S06e03290g1_1 [Lachancea quebecensis]